MKYKTFIKTKGTGLQTTVLNNANSILITKQGQQQSIQ